MKTHLANKPSLLILAFLAICLIATSALALIDPQIPRWAIDGGGGQSDGGGYTLNGTVGQQDSGAMSGGGYTLGGGFWGSKPDPNQASDNQIFLPLTIR